MTKRNIANISHKTSDFCGGHKSGVTTSNFNFYIKQLKVSQTRTMNDVVFAFIADRYALL